MNIVNDLNNTTTGEYYKTHKQNFQWTLQVTSKTVSVD